MCCSEVHLAASNRKLDQQHLKQLRISFSHLVKKKKTTTDRLVLSLVPRLSVRTSTFRTFSACSSWLHSGCCNSWRYICIQGRVFVTLFFNLQRKNIPANFFFDLSCCEIDFRRNLCTVLCFLLSPHPPPEEMHNRGFTFHVKAALYVQYLHFKCLSFCFRSPGSLLRQLGKWANKPKPK